jgi:DNA-binding transcriptional MerR regulator
MSEPLRTGELARHAGVSPASVRLYERRGLLPTAVRTASGYRAFPSEAAERIQMIQCALAVGFTLDELARFFRRRDAGGAPCREVLALAQRKLLELKRRRKQLELLCDFLESTLRSWTAAIEKTPRGRRAGLLQSLSKKAPWLAGIESPLVHGTFGKKRGGNR